CSGLLAKQLPPPARQIHDGNMKVFLRQGLGCFSVRSTSLNPSRYTSITVKSIGRQRPPGDQHPGPKPAVTLIGTLLCCAGLDCHAVDRLALQVGQISTASVQVQGLSMTLDVAPKPESRSPTLRAEVAEVHLPAVGTYRKIEVDCSDLYV